MDADGVLPCAGAGGEAHPSAHGSQRCSVTQHEIMSVLTLCSAYGSVMCERVHPRTAHLGVMLRSVEASVQGHLSERRRPKHQKRSGPVHRGCLSLQPGPVYSRVSRHYQLLWQTPGRWPRPSLSGAGRISPLLSARHSKDPDLPVEGFTWVTCGSILASVASD